MSLDEALRHARALERLSDGGVHFFTAPLVSFVQSAAPPASAGGPRDTSPPPSRLRTPQAKPPGSPSAPAYALHRPPPSPSPPGSGIALFDLVCDDGNLGEYHDELIKLNLYLSRVQWERGTALVTTSWSPAVLTRLSQTSTASSQNSFFLCRS